MMRTLFLAVALTAIAASPVSAQLGQIGKGLAIAKKAQDLRDLQMTDQEEQELGAAVSERIRTRYGVAQDAAVHRYLALVGGALAQGSTRPALPDRVSAAPIWTALLFWIARMVCFSVTCTISCASTPTSSASFLISARAPRVMCT